MVRQQYWTVKSEMQESCNLKEKHCGFRLVLEVNVQKYIRLRNCLK